MPANSWTGETLRGFFVSGYNQFLKALRCLHTRALRVKEDLLLFSWRSSALYNKSYLYQRLSMLYQRLWDPVVSGVVKERWESLLWFALILVAYLPEEQWLYLTLFSSLFLGGLRLGRFTLIVWSLLGWSLVGSLTAPEPLWSTGCLLREALVILAGVFAGLYWGERKNVWKIWALSGLPIVFLGFAQAIAGNSYPAAWVSPEERGQIPFRITGVFENPNSFALYLAFLIPIIISMSLPRNFRQRERNSARLLAGLYFIAILFTFSRTGWVAAGISLFFLWFRENKRSLFRTAVGLMILFILYHPLAFRISPIAVAGENATVSYRLRLWKEGWRLVKEDPLKGVGACGVKRRFPLISALVADHLHNLYLQTLVEKGVVGLILLFILIYLVMISPAKAPAARGVKAALIGQLAAGVMESIWSHPLLLLLFWFGYGYLQSSLGSSEAYLPITD